MQHTPETCPGRPCSTDCDHVEYDCEAEASFWAPIAASAKVKRARHFAREVVHCFPACIIVHLVMEVML